ncbi:uncharacterized protein LOC125717430 isoform X2 [Brienomyrus brachyistius]|uniref:uncharacterized protein LOC125717430 isoform X2 n=1 Tax=Brienomyrus brachyistius TaxID=42636 RepID=UPI0020B43A87|nr:uncharacterized protein LOC125717430 isoform X2 [Brienomyrus brachyistius]
MLTEILSPGCKINLMGRLHCNNFSLLIICTFLQMYPAAVLEDACRGGDVLMHCSVKWEHEIYWFTLAAQTTRTTNIAVVMNKVRNMTRGRYRFSESPDRTITNVMTITNVTAGDQGFYLCMGRVNGKMVISDATQLICKNESVPTATWESSTKTFSLCWTLMGCLLFTTVSTICAHCGFLWYRLRFIHLGTFTKTRRYLKLDSIKPLFSVKRIHESVLPQKTCNSHLLSTDAKIHHGCRSAVGGKQRRSAHRKHMQK